MPKTTKKKYSDLEKHYRGHNEYSVLLRWSDEDDGYVATVPEWPGISAVGATRELAAAEIKDALIAAMSAFEQNDDSCPRPEVIGRKYCGPNFSPRDMLFLYDFVHHPRLRKVRRLALEMVKDTEEFAGLGQGPLLEAVLKRAVDLRILLKFGTSEEKKLESEKWAAP